ncbi:hypothetical protein ACIBKX_38030 [Streptomyces sp. NPDC050658]|uniref:hypothetical protein n=1 Tax=unclassified Streptomyces TaxID=2593676 RepID=UPI0034320E9E
MSGPACCPDGPVVVCFEAVGGAGFGGPYTCGFDAAGGDGFQGPDTYGSNAGRGSGFQAWDGDGHGALGCGGSDAPDDGGLDSAGGGGLGAAGGGSLGGADGAADDDTWRQCADVLFGGRPRPLPEATALLRRVLDRYPGCALALVPCPDGHWAALARSGVRVLIDPVSPTATAPSRLTVVRLASALYGALLPECSRLRRPRHRAACLSPGSAAVPRRGARRSR